MMGFNVALRRGKVFLQDSNYLAHILFGLIIFFGLVYSLILGDRLRFLPDESDYHILAQSIVQSGIYSLDGINPTAFRPPGYPAYLAVFYALDAPMTLMRWSNFVLAAFSLWLVWKMLNDFSGLLAANIGVLLVSGYVVLFYNAGTFYPQTLAATLLLGGLMLWSRSGLNIWAGLLGGLFFSALILTAPIYAFIPLVVTIWRLLFLRKNGRLALLVGWIGLIGLCGIWIFRNYLVFNEILVTTNSGINLFVGNSESTLPGAGRTVDISAYEVQTESMSELEADRYFRSLALEFVREQPFRFISLYFRKVLNYFQYANRYVSNVRGLGMINLVMFVTYIPLLLVFIARYALLSKFSFSAQEILLHSLYLSGAFVIAIFFPRIRFRLPMDYSLIMAVAILLARVLQHKFQPVELKFLSLVR